MEGNVSALLGRIVWAEIADHNGHRKLRPVIVVGVAQTDDSQDFLTVAAVTSRVPDVLPEDHVALPWHPQRHPRTGLNRPSAVVCSWRTAIMTSDIPEIAGIVPKREFVEILTKIAELESKP